MKRELTNEEACSKVKELVEELERGGCDKMCAALAVIALHFKTSEFHTDRLMSVLGQLAELYVEEYEQATGRRFE